MSYSLFTCHGDKGYFWALSWKTPTQHFLPLTHDKISTTMDNADTVQRVWRTSINCQFNVKLHDTEGLVISLSMIKRPLIHKTHCPYKSLSYLRRPHLSSSLLTRTIDFAKRCTRVCQFLRAVNSGVLSPSHCSLTAKLDRMRDSVESGAQYFRRPISWELFSDAGGFAWVFNALGRYMDAHETDPTMEFRL